MCKICQELSNILQASLLYCMRSWWQSLTFGNLSLWGAECAGGDQIEMLPRRLLDWGEENALLSLVHTSTCIEILSSSSKERKSGHSRTGLGGKRTQQCLLSWKVSRVVNSSNLRTNFKRYQWRKVIQSFEKLLQNDYNSSLSESNTCAMNSFDGCCTYSP